MTAAYAIIRTNPRGALTPPRVLTHRLESGERQDAVKATRVCSIPDCTRPFRARTWCATHYARWAKSGDPHKLIKPVLPDTCEVPDCDKPRDRTRYCGAHRARLTRLGTFDLPERDRYQQPSGYWNVKRPGHPLAVDRGWVREHRVVLYDAIGPGEHDCHWCGTTVAWERTYPEHRDGLVVDHIDEDPSNNDPANLVPSCSSCNIQRSSRWVKRARRQEAAK